MTFTSSPIASTTPTNSWPMRCASWVGVTPRYGHRSEPHTQAATTFTMASPPVESTGSGTVSTRMSRGAWMIVASMVRAYARGATRELGVTVPHPAEELTSCASE